MWRLPDPRFDVASALDQGGRDYQEDSLVTDFPIGDDCGIVVLADGMGGHAAGDVASNIVVTEVYGDLKFQRPMFIEREAHLPQIMLESLADANSTLGAHVKANPDSYGMGATLVSLVMVGPNLYWTSVGDSPLYHFRGGRLEQLNEDHSMAPQIDLMVTNGLIGADQAREHPDRNCLTSAILGDQIARIDNPPNGVRLSAGDIVVVSSDGLQFLEDKAIAKLLYRNRKKSSTDICNALLHALKKLDDPDQDNISFAVIKVNHDKPVQSTVRVGAPPLPLVNPLASSLTRLAEQDVVEEIGLQVGDVDTVVKRAAVILDRAAGE